MKTNVSALLVAVLALGAVVISATVAADDEYNYFSITVHVPHEQQFLLNRSVIHERLAEAEIEVLRVDTYNSALIARSPLRQPSSSSIARAFDGTDARLGGIQRIPRPESLGDQ